MEEHDYIARIQAILHKGKNAADEALTVVEDGLRTHLESAALWCLRGDLIRLSEAYADALEEALASYERAAKLDPAFAKAFEGIGRYHESVTGDFQQSVSAYRKALALGAGEASQIGLDRIMAQTGRSLQA